METDLVFKVPTFKAGYFAFSRKYAEEKIGHLVFGARILYETIKDLPILPDFASRLQEEVILKSIFGTAAIEGNPLSEEKVSELLAQPEGTDYVKKAEVEIINLREAYNFLRIIPPLSGPKLINEAEIKDMHGIITKNLESEKNTPGAYRNHLVQVGDAEHGGVYTPPKIRKDIETLMRAYVVWLNGSDMLTLTAPIRAALAHFHLGQIHPFGDGNGRTARLLEAYLMQAAGIKYVPPLLSNYYYRNIDEYYRVYSRSIRNKENDRTDFLEFVLNGLIESLKEIKGKITFFIRLLTLKDFYGILRNKKEITQRQFDFLMMMLETFKPIPASEVARSTPYSILYRGKSDRTLKRDLKKLTDKNFILYDQNGGLYSLNFQLLG
jgi:Fic family protein